MKRQRQIAVALTAAILAACVSVAVPMSAAKPDLKVRLRAQLSGAAVIPGPGDPDSFGSFQVRLLPENGKVCFIASHSNLAPDNPDLGHIHRAAEGSEGPVVVTLFEGIPGQKSSTLGECAKTKPKVLKRLATHPERFYVDLHTPLFPDGALRGQLFKKPPAG